VLAFALGLAFRNTGPGELQVGVAPGAGDSALAATLDSSPRLAATVLDTATARLRLRTGRVALLVVPGDSLVYRYDSTAPTAASRGSRSTTSCSAPAAAKTSPSCATTASSRRDRVTSTS